MNKRVLSQIPKLSTHDFERVASTLEPAEVPWLWYPWFAVGKINVVASPGGVGKGLMLTDIAARVTRGDPMPFSEDPGNVGNILWAESEDDDRATLIPRLTAAKADLDRVAIMDLNEFEEKVTRAFIRRNKIRLIVLSPLISFSGITRPNDEVNVRERLEHIQSLVEDTKCAVIGIMHPNKKADLSALDKLLGSVAFRNFCRSVALLKEEEEDCARMVHGKWNMSRKADDLLFTKRNTRAQSSPKGQYIAINWDKAEDNIDPHAAFERKPLYDPDEGSANEWLEDYLSRQPKKTALCSEIFAAGEARSLSKRTLQTAKARNPRIKHLNNQFGRGQMKWRLVE